MGSGSNTDMAFFQLYTSGTVFTRINRYWLDTNRSETDKDREARFMAYDVFNDNMLIAWPTIYQGTHYLIFVTNENPRSSYCGWWDNTVITSTNINFV